MTNSSRVASLALALSVVFAGPAVMTAEAHTTGIHDNCTNLNKKFPHGVGRQGARDKGGNVTNFKRSNKIYNTANRHNSTLDGDNDGIACEKA